jgi:hypothetical protein
MWQHGLSITDPRQAQNNEEELFFLERAKQS